MKIMRAPHEVASKTNWYGQSFEILGYTYKLFKQLLNSSILNVKQTLLHQGPFNRICDQDESKGLELIIFKVEAPGAAAQCGCQSPNRHWKYKTFWVVICYINHSHLSWTRLWINTAWTFCDRTAAITSSRGIPKLYSPFSTFLLIP